MRFGGERLVVTSDSAFAATVDGGQRLPECGDFLVARSIEKAVDSFLLIMRSKRHVFVATGLGKQCDDTRGKCAMGRVVDIMAKQGL